MPRSLAKKQIACPANTLLEATGAHTYSFKLSQTHSFSQSITHAPLSSPCLMTTCAENEPYTHKDQAWVKTMLQNLPSQHAIKSLFKLPFAFSSSANACWTSFYSSDVLK